MKQRPFNKVRYRLGGVIFGRDTTRGWFQPKYAGRKDLARRVVRLYGRQVLSAGCSDTPINLILLILKVSRQQETSRGRPGRP